MLQWNASAHGGFTTGTPWMRVNDDYPEWNAEQQISDETSVHAFWKRALKVRKTHDALVSRSKYVLIYTCSSFNSIYTITLHFYLHLRIYPLPFFSY